MRPQATAAGDTGKATVQRQAKNSCFTAGRLLDLFFERYAFSDWHDMLPLSLERPGRKTKHCFQWRQMKSDRFKTPGIVKTKSLGPPL